MGTFRKSVMGDVSGKVGNVSTTSWRGKSVIRSRPGPRKKGSATQAQKEQLARFALMIKFLQPLTNFLNQLDRKKQGMSGFNKTFSYNIVQAITGAYPDFRINYPDVQLSRGGQAAVVSVSCTSPSAGQLVFSWPFTGGKSDIADDLIYVAVYNEEMNHWIYSVGEAKRSAGTISLDLSGLTGKAFQTYLGVISAKNGLTSNSNYSGVVTVS